MTIWMFSKFKKSKQKLYEALSEENSWRNLRRSFKINYRIFVESLKKIAQNVSKNGARNHENRGREGVWEVLEAILARKLPWRLSWLILDRRGEAKMAARWPNLAPRWSQLGVSVPHHSLGLHAVLGGYALGYLHYCYTTAMVVGQCASP